MTIQIEDTTIPTAIPGLRFDFNFGARVTVPEGQGQWRVRFIDRDLFMVLSDTKFERGTLTSSLKYYINYRVEIYHEEQLVFTHDLDLNGKNVLLKNVSHALGDTLAWIPYAREFYQKHHCQIYYAMKPALAEFLAPLYPEIHFIGPDEKPDQLYATYFLGTFFPCDDRMRQPVDWRIIGFQKSIALILGLPAKEIRPQLCPVNVPRTITEPYVCIGVQSTSLPKYWNNPHGWSEVVRYLKGLGYRVLCIDQHPSQRFGNQVVSIPPGAEDFTGDKPLQERANMLAHADFFIGYSSGLSWLAWGAGCPVILISGFSLPLAEFYTPYRIINYRCCNGCWSDSKIEFDHSDPFWCPRHKGTERQFECTRLISPGYVKTVIQRLMQDFHYHPNA